MIAGAFLSHFYTEIDSKSWILDCYFSSVENNYFNFKSCLFYVFIVLLAVAPQQVSYGVYSVKP